MVVRRDCDFLMCSGLLRNISRIKKIFFSKGNYGSGNSIGHTGLSTDMKPSTALESGKTSRLYFRYT